MPRVSIWLSVKKRAKVLLAIFLLSSLIQMALPMLSPEVAYANETAEQRAERLAKGWIALATFLRRENLSTMLGSNPNGGDLPITDASIDNLRGIMTDGRNGVWEDCSSNLQVGKIFAPSTGTVNLCGVGNVGNDSISSVFLPAIKAIGVTDARDFMAKLGFVRSTSGSGKWMRGSSYPADVSTDQAKTILQQKVNGIYQSAFLGGTAPTISANADPPLWAQYIELSKIGNNEGCTVDGLLTNQDSNGNTYLVDIQSSSIKRYNVNWRNSNGRKNVAFGSISCVETGNRLGQERYANDYLTFLGLLEDTQPQTCDKSYTSDPSKKDACAAGEDNPGEDAFCPNNYSSGGSELIDACRYGQSLGREGENAAAGESTPDGQQSSCNITDGLGWIICPVVKTAARAVDGIYELFLVPQLRTPPLNMNVDMSTAEGSNNAFYQTWAVIRNIANVLFVIAFLIIVYSQLTGAGINNYGIKKMLPRLIVSAILVNISYFLCAIAVDISNVLGTTLDNLLSNLAMANLSAPSWTDTMSALLGAQAIGGTVVLAGTIAVLSGAGMALLWLAIPILLGALIAVVTAAIVIALRQALIVILIVIAPLAFVAFLLPNTQSLFDKWRKLFVTMLVFFPIFSIIFGGSKLAGVVLINAAGSTDGGGGMFVLMGMFAQIFPLFSAPFVMKFSGGFLGSIGAKIQGGLSRVTAPISKFSRGKAMNNVNYGLKRSTNALAARGGRVGRFVTGMQTRSQRLKMSTEREDAVAQANADERASGVLAGVALSTQEQKMRSERAKARGEALAAEQVAGPLSQLDIDTRIQKERAASAGRVQSSTYAEFIRSTPGAVTAAAGIGGATANTRVRASAIAAETREMAEAVKNIEETSNFPPGDLDSVADAYKNAVTSGDRVGARAYQNMLYKSGAPGHEKWQNATIELESDNNVTSAPSWAEMKTSLRSNIVNNHGNMKSINNAAMNWALDNGEVTQDANGNVTQTRPPRSLSEHFDDPNSFAKLSNEEIISSKAFVQEKALNLHIITQQRAKDLVANVNFDKMGEPIKQRIRAIADGSAT